MNSNLRRLRRSDKSPAPHFVAFAQAAPFHDPSALTPPLHVAASDLEFAQFLLVKLPTHFAGNGCFDPLRSISFRVIIEACVSSVS